MKLVPPSLPRSSYVSLMRFGIVAPRVVCIRALLTLSTVWVPVFISPVVKPRGSEANAEIQNEWSYTACLPCTYLEWTGTDLPYFIYPPHHAFYRFIKSILSPDTRRKVTVEIIGTVTERSNYQLKPNAVSCTYSTEKWDSSVGTRVATDWYSQERFCRPILGSPGLYPSRE